MAPILSPLVMQLGYDPVWFGIIMVIMTEIGLLTPPFGLNLFILSGNMPEVPMRTIYRGVLPFVIVNIVLLLLFILIPDIVLFTPRLFG